MMLMAERDKAVVVPKAGAFCDVVELSPALTTAVPSAYDAAQSGEQVSPAGFGVAHAASLSKLDSKPDFAFQYWRRL